MTSGQTPLRVTEPRELLALIPYQLGFRPTESLVLIGLRRPTNRVGLMARVDLDDLGPNARYPIFSDLAQHLKSDGAGAVIAVIYTATDPRQGNLRIVALALDLREALIDRMADVESVPIWVVTDTGYLNLDCTDPTCCPVGGLSLGDLEGTQVAAEMTLAGEAAPVANREDVVRIPPASPHLRGATAAVRQRWLDSRSKMAEDAWRLGSVRAWRKAVETAQGDASTLLPSLLGRIEAGLSDPRVRDAILTTMVPDTGRLAERLTAGAQASREAESGLGQALGKIMSPTTGIEPPQDLTRVHEQVLAEVVAAGEANKQAPALTLLALLAFWQGHGARADLLVERAECDDEDYQLAQLLGSAVACGMPPGWVQAQGRGLA